jgi:apolipoprotein D and lipocalin family protein
MNKSLIFVGLAVVTLLVGFAANNADVQSYLRKNLTEPVTVPQVDIQKYAGSWYEQSVIPFYFERGCSHTVATYSLNPDGKSIKVENNCTRNGQLVSSTGKAIPEDSTNAKLKVEFVQTLDIGGQYWIVRLGKDYDYSVVSSPNYHYLWILSREKKMAEDKYQAIVADLKKDNYPV